MIVKNCGLALSYIENQTEDICIAAVKNYADALFHVKNQTEKICIAAVGKNGYILQFVENQTENICVAARHILSVLFTESTYLNARPQFVTAAKQISFV